MNTFGAVEAGAALVMATNAVANQRPSISQRQHYRYRNGIVTITCIKSSFFRIGFRERKDEEVLLLRKWEDVLEI